jgi:hypothetical protein
MSNQENEKFRKRENVLKRALLSLLVYAPALLGSGIILSSKGPLTGSILGPGCFLAGFSGIIMIVRRESPSSIGSLRGKWAVVEGVILTAIFWIAGLYFSFFDLK